MYFDRKRARLQLEAGGSEQQLGKGGKGEKADVVQAVSQICPKVPYTPPKIPNAHSTFTKCTFTYITDTPGGLYHQSRGKREERKASCSPNTQCIRIPCMQPKVPNTHFKKTTPVTKA